MKDIIILMLSLIACCTSLAQTINITDKSTGAPLTHVHIRSEDPEAHAYTDDNGNADISSFVGAELIIISSVGHESIYTSYPTLRQADFSIAMNIARVILKDVVVSATRWDQSSRDVPAEILSIAPQEVALQNPQTAADMLGSSGAVFIQKSQQGGGSPMIRGFSTNRLLYTVDGVRMNTAIFRSGNLQNIISLDPFATQSTEVIFGPGSVIYGSDAIGGVMSIQSLKPGFAEASKSQISGNAAVRLASANDEITGHLDISMSGRKWAFLTSISGNDYGDLKMGSRGPDAYLRPFYVERQGNSDVIVENPDPEIQIPTGYQQGNLMQKVRFKPNQAIEFQYGLHVSRTTKYGRYDRHIRLRDGQPISGQWDYGPQNWTMHHLQGTHTAFNKLYDRARLSVAYQHFEESRIDRDFTDTIQRKRRELVDAYSVNLDFNKTLDKSTRLYYGLEAVLNDVTSRGELTDLITRETSPTAARYPQATWATYAAYFSFQKDLSRKLLLQFGSRISAFSLDADFSENAAFFPLPFDRAELRKGALIGSAGLVYKPTDNASLHANLSTGFRAPNVDDVGKIFDSEPGSVIVPNKDLKPEYAYNAEIGTKTNLGDAVTLDVAVFYTFLDQALVRRNFTLSGQDSIVYDGVPSQVQAIQNAASAHVYGVQAAIDVKIAPGLTLLSRFNVQIGEEETDDGQTSPSRHAAPAFGITRLTYSPGDIWQVQMYAAYSAERAFEDLAFEERAKEYLYTPDQNGDPFAPGWITLNLKASWQITTSFTLAAGLENITDKRYRPYSSGLAAPGRNGIVSLRAAF